MRHNEDMSQLSPSVSGAYIAQSGTPVRARLPSTWPQTPDTPDAEFLNQLEGIIREGVLDELRNVIDDVVAQNGSVEHRGHVLGAAMMCALDTVSSFTCSIPPEARMENFVREYFPSDFHDYAKDICLRYRNSMVHSWFLFKVAFTPGDEPVHKGPDEILTMGIMTFSQGLESAADNFFAALHDDATLAKLALNRYRGLRSEAKG